MKNIIKITIALLALLFTATAQAQNLLDYTSGDLSVKVLNNLFGELISNEFGGQDPLLNAIKIFNSGVLIVGGILASYTTFAGIIGTAHDGEMMGKKFSSVWIPIRYSIGTALILPVVGGGYCLIQVLVMWLVLAGVGLADTVYVAWMSNPVLNSDVKVAAYGNNGILPVAENIFAMNIYIEAHDKAQDERYIQFFGKTNYQAVEQDNQIFFGSDKNKKSGGTITFPEPKNITINRKEHTNNPGVIGNIGQLFQSVDFSQLTDEHKKQTYILNNKLNALAKQAVLEQENGTLNPELTYQKIKEYAHDYKLAIDNKGQEYTKNLNLLSSAVQNGWLVAGFSFFNNINVNNNLTNSIQSVSQAQANMNYKKFGAYEKDALKYLSIVPKVLSNSKNPQVIANLDDDYQEQETASSFTQNISATIAEAYTGINILELQDDTRHPIMIVNEMGHRIIKANSYLISGITISSIILGAIALIAGSGIAAGANVFIVSILPLTAGLWTVAIFSAYVIPLIPTLIWLGGIIGFFFLVIEAIIAAPLWAVMHLHPQGDDLTGKGGAGYSLVLSLLLRPVLMIFGFLAAMKLSQIGGEIVNKIFFQMFDSINIGNNSGISGMAGVFGSTAMYAVIMFIILYKSFEITFKLPDQILRWISGTQENMGAFAGGFSNSIQSASNKGVAATAGIAAMGVNKITNSLQAPKSSPGSEPGGSGANSGGASQTVLNDKEKMMNKNNSSNSNDDKKQSNPDSFSSQTKNKIDKDDDKDSKFKPLN